jgi:phage terminase large subunit-like protein
VAAGKARYNGDEHKFTFPLGNTLQFGHMEHEDAKYDYQGGIWAFIGVDEATQFTETHADLPADPPAAAGRVPGADPLAGGLEPRRPRPRVRQAPVHPGRERRKDPSTPDRQFFPARIDDNPNLDREEYVRQLKESGIDGILLDQLLRGDWDAVPGGRFQREWFRSYRWRGDYCCPDGRAEFKPKECRRFVTVDPAASAKTTADYTVISTWCVSPWGDLVWLACDRFRATIPDILPRVQKAVRRWNPAWVGIEAIGANSAVYQLACTVKDPTVPACPINKGDRDKLVHATRGIVLASTGRVFLPAEGQDAGFPREDVLSELVRFTGDEKVDAHDDVVDTLSYAAELIDWLPAPKGAAPRVLGGVR